MEKAFNFADLISSDTGKTFREENEEKKHNIPLGTLVEVDVDDYYLENPKKGLRLFVVSHDRDCDGTPLYSLSFNKNWKKDKYGEKFELLNKAQIDSGYDENSLKIVK